MDQEIGKVIQEAKEEVHKRTGVNSTGSRLKIKQKTSSLGTIFVKIQLCSETCARNKNGKGK